MRGEGLPPCQPDLKLDDAIGASARFERLDMTKRRAGRPSSALATFLWRSFRRAFSSQPTGSFATTVVFRRNLHYLTGPDGERFIDVRNEEIDYLVARDGVFVDALCPRRTIEVFVRPVTQRGRPAKP